MIIIFYQVHEYIIQDCGGGGRSVAEMLCLCVALVQS